MATFAGHFCKHYRSVAPTRSDSVEISLPKIWRRVTSPKDESGGGCKHSNVIRKMI